MGRREGMIKYVLRSANHTKVGKAEPSLRSREGKYQKDPDLETKVKIKMAQHGGRRESSSRIFTGEPWRATTTEGRQEGKHREPTS